MKYLSNVVSLRHFPDRCTGCGRCAEVCPHGVFEMKGKKAFLTDKDLCMECGACASNCKHGAIIVNAGVGCAAALINSIVTGSPPSCGCDESENGQSGCC